MQRLLQRGPKPLAAGPVMSEQRSRPAPFNASTAVLSAGFAFEVYNSPAEARWERGADGCDVAFMSDAFACEVYAGRVEIRLREAKELAATQDMAQSLVSGTERDPYVIFAMNEETEEGPKEGAVGLGRAVDRARSRTAWSLNLAEQLMQRGREKGSAKWLEDEPVLYLYVKDPARAQLALTVFDEEVGIASDIVLGATSRHLRDLVATDADASLEKRSWSGWLPLTWRPEETRDNAMLLGTVAGAAVAGPVGAAAGGVLASTFLKKPVQGQIFVELTYTPLTPPAPSEPSEAAKPSPDVEALGGEELMLRSVPKGGTEGIDWSTLADRVAAEERTKFELCCFLTHSETSTEAAIWRDVDRRLVVISFRGTSDVRDAVTDVSIVQTPLEAPSVPGQKSDDPRQVHSGFFASARAVGRRLKELLVLACAGTPGDWELLITGHSLGGALATLMSTELVGAVDTSRGFRERPDSSWLGRVKDLFTGVQEAFTGELPRWRAVELYTFGAPRVGNTAFAEYFEELFEGREAFRIVNDRDIVPRLPRTGTATGAVLDYEHCGRTVLIAEQSAEAVGFDGFWVEGTSEDAVCPLRDASPLSNPLQPGRVLGDLTGNIGAFTSKVRGAIDAAAQKRSRAELQRATEAALADWKETQASLATRVSDTDIAEVLGAFGLDPKFVKSEIALAESIGRGTALEHHLEPSYFLAMTKALDAALGSKTLYEESQ